MGVYEKMKAVIYDLSETIDEAVAAKSYVSSKKLALAGVCYAREAMQSVQNEQARKYGDASRFSQLKIS